jgi:hypothetical protein
MRVILMFTFLVLAAASAAQAAAPVAFDPGGDGPTCPAPRPEPIRPSC